MISILDTFKFVHSLNRFLGLGHEQCLATGRVQVGVADVGEVQGPDSRAVDEEGGRGVILQERGEGRIVPPDEGDAFG